MTLERAQYLYDRSCERIKYIESTSWKNPDDKIRQLAYEKGRKDVLNEVIMDFAEQEALHDLYGI